MEEEEAPKTMLAAAAQAPEGTHFAANEAEVEDAILYRTVDLGAAKAAKTQTTAANDAESETVVPAGKIIRRDDVFAVFQPTAISVVPKLLEFLRPPRSGRSSGWATNSWPYGSRRGKRSCCAST